MEGLGILDYLLGGGVGSIGAFLLWRVTRNEKRIDEFSAEVLTRLDKFTNSILTNMKELTNSISELNVTMARNIERTDSLDRRVTRLEDKN